eukprot:6455633-Prymnesium_polylepis.1
MPVLFHTLSLTLKATLFGTLRNARRMTCRAQRAAHRCLPVTRRWALPNSALGRGDPSEPPETADTRHNDMRSGNGGHAT